METPFPGDPDLAAHITILLKRGITLSGQKAADVFPEVPLEDYLDAIMDDFESAREQIVDTPIYSILNLCRVYSFVKSGSILSKKEGGKWGAGMLPEPFNRTAEKAYLIYSGKVYEDCFSDDLLLAFSDYVFQKVNELLSERGIRSDNRAKSIGLYYQENRRED
ncbi:DUF4111 domain-containing protein [Pseudalkalibacillus caeni]|uniref:DUF4111 domain-containing protein n=1 Tax=Exobacillus caeni TaxID=2574798 RepID=A0A5R9F8U4_9BACL|nr:DUF4111 domain-containing protein [Pseudalkalibacillus caeni]TLS38038.1 DUF4111 domain-containing protein [Pseudalkalibacillus caeni]